MKAVEVQSIGGPETLRLIDIPTRYRVQRMS